MNLELAKRILGLHYAVTEDELKSIYRRLCLEVHPDKNPSIRAKEEFLALQEAYDYVRRNIPMLPPAPKPEPIGDHVYRFFHSKEPRVVVPPEALIEKDLILHFYWDGREYRTIVPKGTELPGTLTVEGTPLIIYLIREEAPGVDPEPPIGTVWGRDYLK